MSQDAGVVYNTRQAAEALGVGAAMMRRYAQTLEEVTGEEIPQTRRDGRQFSREHLDMLLQAKALVDSHNGLSVEAALRMATSATNDGEGLRVGLPIGSIADSAALIEALREAITAPLVAELRELRADRDEVQALRNEVKALRSELAETRVLPPGVNNERIDRALEVEMQERQAAQEISPAAQKVVNTINSVKPQRPEQESWITEAAVQALIEASELPIENQGRSESNKSPSEAQDSSDGLMVWAARWLERWLYRKR